MPDIVNAGMALSAMRFAPYKTPSALAELIDNSIQAKAENISLIAKDKYVETQSGQVVSRLDQLAVYDDGEGMDRETIESALAVGFSRNKDDPNGIGRFGFGMTVGSVSQCFRVEVYSWQNNGPIYHTYIDLNELLESGTQTIPEIEEVTEVPLIAGHNREGITKKESGTLVRWMNLDFQKVQYKTSSGIYNFLNSELGRIYRHYLDDDDDYGRQRNIRIISLSADNDISSINPIVANDPLYLLTPNTLPPCNGEQYRDKQTNVLLEDRIHELPITYLDKNGEEKVSVVEIRATVAKPEIRSNLGGASSVGKHYSKNLGISFVRAGREITLDTKGWVNSYDPTERWWGIEVRFQPCLDEVFGVTNDKQFIKNIVKLDDSTADEYYEGADSDHSVNGNIKINDLIKPLITSLRKIVKSSPVNRGGQNRNTVITEERVNVRVSQDTTDRSSEQIAQEKTREEKIEQLAQVLMENDPTLEETNAIARAEERIDRIVDFQLRDWPGSMFLERGYMANGVHAELNIRSHFYRHFYEYLENMEDSKPVEAVKIILMAYIRTEDELSVRYDPDDEIFPSFRERWGYWVQELVRISDDV